MAHNLSITRITVTNFSYEAVSTTAQRNICSVAIRWTGKLSGTI